MRGLESAYDNEDFSKERERAERGRGGFAWIGPQDFAPGTSVRARFIASSDKCPDGYHRYTTHAIWNNAADKHPVKVLCTESFNDVRYDASGAVIKRDCFCCDLYAWLKMEGLLDKIDAQEPQLAAVIQKACSIYSCRTTLFPMIIQADRIRIPQEDPDKEVYEIRPNPMAYTTVVLAVREGDGTRESPLISQIGTICRAHPNIANTQLGSWVTLTRPQRAPLTIGGVEPAAPLMIPDMKVMERIVKSYPNIRNWGQTDNKSKPGSNIRRTYSFAKNLVRNSYWGQDLPRYGVEWEDFLESVSTTFIL